MRQKEFTNMEVIHINIGSSVTYILLLDIPTQTNRSRKDMSRRMGKPIVCIGENKGADQLRSNCEADQHLCFRYKDSTIPLLSKSKISSLKPSSMIVQLGLCRTWSETQTVGFLIHRLILV